MKGFLPLLADFITRLREDIELTTILGAAPVVYSERPADTASAPFFVIDLVSAVPAASATYAGTEYVLQVNFYALRREQGEERGPRDLGLVADRLTVLFHDNDGFDLAESEGGEPVERRNSAPGSYPVTGPRNRLTLRHFEGGNLFTDAAEEWAAVNARFRCVVLTNRS